MNTINRIKRIFFSLMFNFGFSFSFSIIVARLMSISDRGVFYTYQMLSLTIVALASLSISQSIVVSLNRANCKSIDISSLFSFLLISALGSGLISFIFIELFFQNIRLLPIFLISFTGILSSSFIDVFKISDNMKSYSIAYSILPFSQFFSLLFFLNGFAASLKHVIYVVVISQFVTFIVFCCLFAKEYTIDNSYKFFLCRSRSFWIYAIKMTLLKGLGVINQHVDKLVLASLFSPMTMGLYAICMSLESVSARTFTILSDSVFSLSTKCKGGINRSIIHFFVLSVIIGLLGFLFSLIFGDILIITIFGAKFRSASELLPYIIAISVFSGWSWVLSQYYVANGYFSFIYVRQILSICLFFILIYIVFGPGKEINVIYSSVLAAFFRLIITITYLFVGKYKTVKLNE